MRHTEWDAGQWSGSGNIYELTLPDVVCGHVRCWHGAGLVLWKVGERIRSGALCWRDLLRAGLNVSEFSSIVYGLLRGVTCDMVS